MSSKFGKPVLSSLEAEFCSLFDVVIVLSWSDWDNEPRSNRFHYSTRFARLLPVIFLQHPKAQTASIKVRPSAFENLDIVNFNAPVDPNTVRQVLELMKARGFTRPLLWIYDSLNYDLLMDALPCSFRVYHATEDYFTPACFTPTDQRIKVGESFRDLQQSVRELLLKVNLVIACSEGVAESLRSKAGYGKPISVIENGCDASFFRMALPAWPDTVRKPYPAPIAIYQGGINERLDYDLMCGVVEQMSDWTFVFAGKLADSPGARRLFAYSNVSYLGTLNAEQLASAMKASTVGLIPFIQSDLIDGSLPLKAYEYVAADLPVVSVPIAALDDKPSLFKIETSPTGFAEAMRVMAGDRNDAELLALRRSSADENSYDERFQSALETIVGTRSTLQGAVKRLRIAVLYDLASVHVGAIQDHLMSFKRYSRHEITYVPATQSYWKDLPKRLHRSFDLSEFDVVVVHYSVRLSLKGHLSPTVAGKVELFRGLKVLFIQDEYENTETARSWMDRLKFDFVYTCVPQQYVNDVYPSWRFPATTFVQTLTGYVHLNDEDRMVRPLRDRPFDIVYRGRSLHPVYGLLGQQKSRIGEEFRKLGLSRQLRVDIEIDDHKRVYGDDWIRLLASSRTTLGTESGSNVFDIDGSLRKKIDSALIADPELSFEDIQETLLPAETIEMNQISPKVFEAIRMRTALILIEGEYSGVLRPWDHYIPLKRDFSNVNECLDLIRDDDFLHAMVERAHRDIVESEVYSYGNFVSAFDETISAQLLHPVVEDRSLYSFFSLTKQGRIEATIPPSPRDPVGFIKTNSDLPGALARQSERESREFTFSSVAGDWLTTRFSISASVFKRVLRHSYHLLPVAIRTKLGLGYRLEQRRQGR